jgi:hypothetical protein
MDLLYKESNGGAKSSVPLITKTRSNTSLVENPVPKLLWLVILFVSSSMPYFPDKSLGEQE